MPTKPGTIDRFTAIQRAKRIQLNPSVRKKQRDNKKVRINPPPGQGVDGRLQQKKPENLPGFARSIPVNDVSVAQQILQYWGQRQNIEKESQEPTRWYNNWRPLDPIRGLRSTTG